MIPYLLAIAGGYLIGQSQIDKISFAKFDEGGTVFNPDFMTTQDLKSVNADFFESNLNFDNTMKKYAALPYGGLYVYNGKDWQIIPRTSEISNERDAKKFLFAQLRNEEKFSIALDELEKSHP